MPLTRSASVCALVPHYDCGQWLAGAIESLLAQTRSLDGLIVLDDASSEAPLSAASRYPSVTFLRAPANVGPYRMLQTAIERTDFDAYLLQDADDVSHPERLASLLEVAEIHGADIVGSHEVQIDVTAPEARTREYPLDVNAALADNPIAFALLHPTSLISRELVLRAGGFPGGLRFSGDVEFLWRAGHCARILNADRHLYLRRCHPGSLTGSRATGSRSPARRALDGALRVRARANAGRVAAGQAPDLSPFSDAPPVDFEHLAGPPVGSRPTAGPRLRPSEAAGPVLVAGGPRNGGDVLSWALDLHPSFEAVPDVADLDMRSLATGLRPVVAGPGVTASALALADRHPAARILWVDRDVETTVDSLVARPDAHGDFYSEHSAREAAVELGAACDLLAVALGPERVLRVPLAHLVEDPPGALGAILTFLGEEHFTGAALALAGLRAEAGQGIRHHAGMSAIAARQVLEEPRRLTLPPLAARLHALASPHLGPDAVVAVVSRGDQSLVDLGLGRGWHFPAANDGSYAGEYPPSGAAAVALLEDVRGRGATHLLVPAPASWWLIHYDELRHHLDRRYCVVAADEGTGSLYDLTARTVPVTSGRQVVSR